MSIRLKTFDIFFCVSWLFVCPIFFVYLRPISYDLISYKEWVEDKDISYEFLFDIQNLIFDDIGYFIYFNSVLILTGFLYFLKIFEVLNGKVLFMSGPLFMFSSSFICLSLSTNVMRNGQAISFAIMLIYFVIINRSLILKFLAFLVPIFFHWTGFLTYIFYYFLRFKLGFKTILTFFMMVFLVYILVFFFYPDFFDKVLLYASLEVYSEERGSQLPRFILHAILMIFICFYFRWVVSFYKVFFILCALFCIHFFPEMYSRIGMWVGYLLFGLFYIVISRRQNGLPFLCRLFFVFLIFFINILHPSTKAIFS